jgi:hypothetical protein
MMANGRSNKKKAKTGMMDPVSRAAADEISLDSVGNGRSAMQAGEVDVVKNRTQDESLVCESV